MFFEAKAREDQKETPPVLGCLGEVQSRLIQSSKWQSKAGDPLCVAGLLVRFGRARKSRGVANNPWYGLLQPLTKNKRNQNLKTFKQMQGSASSAFCAQLAFFKPKGRLAGNLEHLPSLLLKTTPKAGTSKGNCNWQLTGFAGTKAPMRGLASHYFSDVDVSIRSGNPNRASIA